MTAPNFASVGKKAGTIDVRLSYRIIELFSEGLYSSPNKAIEELVANSFDAGALRVNVMLSSNLNDQAATIAIIDDGQGMDIKGMKQHWLIGISNKRNLGSLPRNRQQIGKFGIGKLATYVLANRLTHVSKVNGKYYSTSMDYAAIESRVKKEVEPKTPIRIVVRQLGESEAKGALATWIETPSFKNGKLTLFGAKAPPTWTAAIMSSLKPKVNEIRPGTLRWVLKTALPLRPDFGIRLDDEDLTSSKRGKGLIKSWVIGKDLVDLPRPGPKETVKSEDKSVPSTDERRFGIELPNLGRVWGYAEAYKDLLTGKSDDLGRSYGFFIYVYGRLINVSDGHFGISPNELRHGTFGRFRAVIHMDALDNALRSNRESLSEGPALTEAQNVLRAIFNAVRQTIEAHDDTEEPGAKLARKLASSPASLSRRPIIDLARSVLEGKVKSRYLIVPTLPNDQEKEKFIETIEARAADAETFVTGLTIDYDGAATDGLARFDTTSGILRINAWHPFVATFHDEFASKGAGQPLELLAMAEVLSEAHLHAIGIPKARVDDYLALRDQLLRNLANESSRKSAFAVAKDLVDARNDADRLEAEVCAAFRSLGFETIRIGNKKKPDGVATAHLAVGEDGPRAYKVSLEAKSTEKDSKKVAAASVNVSRIARHRDDYRCQHALVVGRDFPTTRDDSALEIEIDADRQNALANGERKTITLIQIDDLAKLVRLRPLKQLGLEQLRQLFLTCRLPNESRRWVEAVSEKKVVRPPYKVIVYTIEELQKKYNRARVSYGSLRVALSIHGAEFATDEELMELCSGMEQMAPGALFTTADNVELDQSAENVVAAIENATRDYTRIKA